MSKYAVPYRAQAPMGGVKLTGGRLGQAFRNNIAFLKGFDPDRMMYYYRVHAGKPAPSVPYAWQSGHFEINLKGQTAGEFLSGACTTLLWEEDSELRAMADQVVAEIDACKEDNGFLMPISYEEFHTKEYPNYTRAWITFGLLDAGYAGNQRAFELARGMTDFFNHSDVLPYVKDMNLGFQGILVGTRVYDSPVGTKEDIDVCERHYAEPWWLQQLMRDDHRAIYQHPGNHPHSTLLTSLEAYCDLYRVTGHEYYIEAVRHALRMYEDKWQHVGGGINMCEGDTYYPGCNWLGMRHSYNELCSTNFWVLLNQRMHLLEPENEHYVDEMENSIYNVLLAAQVGDRGFHYLNFLEGGKDARWQDRCTCCASLGTRLVGLLPQMLYTTYDNTVSVDLYAPSVATLNIATGRVKLACETDIPDGGHVKLEVLEANAPFLMNVRIPRWSAGSVTIFINGVPSAERYHGYVTLPVEPGDVVEFDIPMCFKVTHYTGGEELVGKQRYALEYGPLLYAAMGPSIVELRWDVMHPEEEFEFIPGTKRKLRMKHDNAHEYWAYIDIDDEPFSVYPVVYRPEWA